MASQFQVTLESPTQQGSIGAWIMCWLFTPLEGSVTLFSYLAYLTWTENRLELFIDIGGGERVQIYAISITVVGLC